jgi:hypothetical protein
MLLLQNVDRKLDALKVAVALVLTSFQPEQ